MRYQAPHEALGFVNLMLYKLASLPSTYEAAFFDVTPGDKQAIARIDYLNGINAREGVLTARGFDSTTGSGTPGAGFLAEVSSP